jgi:hypothetical protein
MARGVTARMVIVFITNRGKLMKTKTLSISTVLGFLGLILMIHTFNAHSATPAITCSTAFGEKTFTIESNKIAFHKEDEKGVSRSISSIKGESVRTHTKNQGFTKTLYIDGNKHRIKVQNVNEFSEVNDYLSITSPKGHEMTYPLTCHSA